MLGRVFAVVVECRVTHDCKLSEEAPLVLFLIIAVVVVVVLVVTTPRSEDFPYFRTVRGVLPANEVAQIHHLRRPCPDPLLPSLPPFQPSPLASCLTGFARQPLLEPDRMVEDSNLR